MHGNDAAPPPARPDAGGAERVRTPDLPPAPRARRRGLKGTVGLVASIPLATLGVVALAEAWTSDLGEPAPSVAAHVVGTLGALLALAGAAALSFASLADVSPTAAAEKSSRVARTIAIVSFVPLVGAFAAGLVPYLVGCVLRARGVGDARRRMVWTILVCLLAAAADVFWVGASVGL